MIDLLFLTHNRLAFARVALAALIENTDWSQVERFVCYDDASTDGTREWLDHGLADVPVPIVLRAEDLGSPVALMQRHIDDPDSADTFAKIDSDTVVPPGWLESMLDVYTATPALELLGMEAGMTTRPSPWDYTGERTAWPATHIGGVGVFSTVAFRIRQPMKPDGRYGLTEWQHWHRPKRAWIAPDLPVIQLDRLPFEPWLTLTEVYCAKGWSRRWEPWPAHLSWAWNWFEPTFELAPLVPVREVAV